MFIGLAVEKVPILATEAVKVINDNVKENEVVEILGHPLKIQAEREFIIFLEFQSKYIFSSLFEARRDKIHKGVLGLDDRHKPHLSVLCRSAHLDTHLHLQTEMGKSIYLRQKQKLCSRAARRSTTS